MEMDRAEPITIIIKTDNRILTNIFPDRVPPVWLYIRKIHVFYIYIFPPSFCPPFSPDLMLKTFQSLDTLIGGLEKKKNKSEIKIQEGRENGHKLSIDKMSAAIRHIFPC